MKFVHLKTSKVKNSRWFVLKSLSVLNYSNKIYFQFYFHLEMFYPAKLHVSEGCPPILDGHFSKPNSC